MTREPKLLDKCEQKSIEFWDDIGSGIPKHEGQDWEEWAKEVCRTAWHNGFYHGRYTIGYNDMLEKDNDLTIAYMAGYHKAKDECKDDFESRICKNCKYFIHELYDESKCMSYHSKVYFTDKDFGCLKFERKEDEK